MEQQLIFILMSSLGTGLATYLGIKVDLSWIKDTLKRHEKYHDDHFSFYNRRKQDV